MNRISRLLQISSAAAFANYWSRLEPSDEVWEELGEIPSLTDIYEPGVEEETRKLDGTRWMGYQEMVESFEE